MQKFGHGWGVASLAPIGADLDQTVRKRRWWEIGVGGLIGARPAMERGCIGELAGVAPK